MSDDTRILVKLRPSSSLRAAESRAKLRPLGVTPEARAAAFGATGEPQWFVAELPDGAASPWDLAHARVAEQLGVAESDVVFAEPDLVHRAFIDDGDGLPEGEAFALGLDCNANAQQGTNGKAKGPGHAWHLNDDFAQLEAARAAVAFADPRIRVAHIDTGYFRAHATKPAHVLQMLEHNFVERDGRPDSAEDPDNRKILLDNSGHGTGTISILAGREDPANPGRVLGGAPEADIIPLRIADSVVLLRTSAFASALDYAVSMGCAVGTMSMGGLPTRVWRESVDKAYLAGFTLCAAAGNNVNGLPTRHIVYPARYGRVIAVCGVMADGRPYAGLTGATTMEGNYGPDSKMKSAIAAWTPNIPWARFGCPQVVRLNGEGTSSATPQVAAAAALWLEKYKALLPRDWRRVEAVRHALFTTARKGAGHDPGKLGNGILRAADALAVAPKLGLPQTKSDGDSFAFLRVITGLGVTTIPPREEMFNLELAQRWLLNPELQAIVPDPDTADPLDERQLRAFMEAVVEDRGASRALRTHVAKRYPTAAGGSVKRTEGNADVVAPVLVACDAEPELHDPAHRRLRVYAVDPSLSTRLETAEINETTLQVRWEPLKKGPVGEYLEVVDRDASGKRYKPVDLDDARLLAQDGWAPSEGNAQFHQQMVYAVAMTTIEHFERALGRPVLWRFTPNPAKPRDDSTFTQRLRVAPHALRQANAFYSPAEIALQFGYFEASADDPGDHMPGSRVYSCLSHDIVAHETTHAILDGMHRRFNEPTNLDVLALHEGFADVVALMQHFTIPDILRHEIARTRGNLEAESILGSLAVQFGHATGGRGALRDAIGRMVDGRWTRIAPDPAELAKRVTPHARGAILVAAVFDAFLAIYRARTADLLRIYTGGTGELPAGAVHPDLVARLADEAATSASHVLRMCIRALDYLPPVDVTFFEYLRALITADADLVSDDRYNYRVAFVEAFRGRGIYPVNLADAPSLDTVRTLSVDTLRWQGFGQADITTAARTQYTEIVEGLKSYADASLYVPTRAELFAMTHKRRRALHDQLEKAFRAVPSFATALGLDAKHSFEVHELRRASRMSPDGRHVPQLVVALTQETTVKADPATGTPAFPFRGGSTLVVDLTIPAVKYRIVKNMNSVERRARTATFAREAAADPLRALFFAPGRREPFAALHALADEGF